MVRPASRILISALLLAPSGSYRSAGIHTYIQHSLQHLPEAASALRLTLLTAHPPAELPAAIEVQRPRWNTDRPALRILWEQLALPLAVQRAQAAVLHATAFVAPIVRACPTVITIYDVSFALFPQFFRGFNQTYLRVGTRWSARHAQRIVTISDCTRRDVHRLYGVPPERIDVAYPGVDETLRRAAPEQVQEFRRLKNLPDKFLLYLGTLEPRKNLTMLVQAFAQLKREYPEAVLVLAGGVGWLAAEIFAAIESEGVKDSVVLPGYIATEEKALWYAAATAFVFPSFYEGFGLPPLEAMACGTPVITANTASLPEVVGAAGLMVAPGDLRGWTAALKRVWTDAPYRAELANRGVRQARQFTWQATSRQIVQAYHQLIKDHS
ncbi:mannosyl-N-acetyl-alpha-D-glucosaminyl-diphospho-ditrans,octacis-undecaprenol 3-alpha-mannosyltransferase / alpha-1,3-rhamnosyltransferase [Thermoflexales bacterium]|nr:mannosyl-N-acetyl-alpha-D-glucosaminyl-diphospho-ditrans,octacis-undecaprenol 3-alpha-mannosyltransferase / alpha-1,3-rhamnosyltransferase [Thermoflexales bacterium]